MEKTVGLYRFTNQLHLIGIVDIQQQDRIIPRDTEPPESRLA